MLAVDWTSNEMIALYIALALVVGVVVAVLVLRNTVRTRMRTERQIRDDPDINEWLVVFDWTPKVLYTPTILASLLAAGMMVLHNRGWLPERITPEMIGGVWFLVVLVNFLVEEYEINLRILLIGMLVVAFGLLWLHLVGSVASTLRLFGHLAISLSATAYLLVAIIGLVTIAVSWIKGLFYYVALTPNYMNVQEGPTESGEQVSREDYNTRVNTGDFLERLLGFGRIVITFKDNRRLPIVLLVWRIDRKAQLLEEVRGSIAIDKSVA
ncbi:MAG: hypothetical protein GXY33_20260 [Phycisphaerae bacterium]|nr:hypothetical protein [Phycisphaerae bacterium]